MAATPRPWGRNGSGNEPAAARIRAAEDGGGVGCLLSAGSAGLWSPTTTSSGGSDSVADLLWMLERGRGASVSRDANSDVGSEAQRLEPGPARCPSAVASRLYG